MQKHPDQIQFVMLYVLWASGGQVWTNAQLYFLMWYFVLSNN